MIQKKFGNGVHDILGRGHTMLRHTRAKLKRDVAIINQSFLFYFCQKQHG